MSTSYYFSLSLILSVTHIYIHIYTYIYIYLYTYIHSLNSPLNMIKQGFSQTQIHVQLHQVSS